MAKASPLQSNFNGGEFGPLVQARVEAERYKTGLAKCFNYVPLVQGALTRRPGSYHVNTAKDSSKETRVVKFEFSTTQAYILEFGDEYIRFYKDYGQILNLGLPYEIVSPFQEADLFDLNFNQSADVLYITHPLYPQMKLSRTGHTAWTLTEISFLDGPYLATNITATTLTPSATTGSVTVTASSVVGINGGIGFQTTDIGRHIRVMTSGPVWIWAIITARASTTQVTATIQGTGSWPTSAHATWRLGLWSDTTGYPAVSTFHEDRLGYAGSASAGQRADFSNSGDYENFAPTDADGTLTDSRALAFTLNSNDVNNIRWMISEERALLAGTAAGEWTIRPSVQNEALTPSNVNAKQVTFFGSAPVTPVVAGKSVIFVQRSKKKVREISYFYEVDGFRSPDRTLLASHITGTSGIKQMAHQKEPQSLVWAVRNDGVLVAMTYEKEEDSLIVGWHEHQLGGVGDSSGNPPKVKSLAVIPSPDGTREDLWLVVERWIDGAIVKSIEWVTPFFDEATDQKDAFFVDCGLTYDNPKTITAITKANPAVVTSVAHGFSNGDFLLINEVSGMTQINGATYVVRNKTNDTFELEDVQGNAVDSSAFTTYTTGGEARKYVTIISGLDHLEGETVDILGDGAVQPSRVVVSGSITLATRATTIHIGLGYRSRGQLLRLEAGAADGTALGKTRRTHRVGVYFYRSLGLQIGFNFDQLTPLTFRKTSDPASRATDLFSGIRSETVEAPYDTENQFCWEQDQPLPSTILAIAPQMHTQDAG